MAEREAQENNQTPELNPNATSGTISSVDQLSTFPELEQVVKDIRNAFPDPSPKPADELKTKSTDP